jgi:hypothetical protein
MYVNVTRNPPGVANVLLMCCKCVANACDTCLKTLQRQEEEERARTREEEEACAGVDPFMEDSDSEVCITCA